jgi:hypothetical protein
VKFGGQKEKKRATRMFGEQRTCSWVNTKLLPIIHMGLLEKCGGSVGSAIPTEGVNVEREEGVFFSHNDKTRIKTKKSSAFGLEEVKNTKHAIIRKRVILMYLKLDQTR